MLYARGGCLGVCDAHCKRFGCCRPVLPVRSVTLALRVCTAMQVAGVGGRRARSVGRRDRMRMRGINVYRAVLAFVGSVAVAIVAVSVYVNTNVTPEEPNGCGMSYFDLNEYAFAPQPPAAPEWVGVGHPDRQHSHRLYRYVEAGANRSAVHSAPIVFIHGNSGSWRQARSFATRISQARRALIALAATRAATTTAGAGGGAGAAVARAPVLEADYFTIDFSEEKSAFSGRLTWRQALYVNECIQHIRQLYNASRALPALPRVIIVAHSMGGIVARGIFRMPNFVRGSVSAILTLGAPHADPFIVPDRELQYFYEQTNALWRAPQSQPEIADVFVVSISGGFRDHLIEPHLSDVAMLIPPSHAVSVLATAIPNVRLTVDHQCLLWCSQLMTVVANALTDMIADPKRALNVQYHEKMLTSPLRRSMEPVIARFQAAATTADSLQSQSAASNGLLFRAHVSSFAAARNLWIPPAPPGAAAAKWAGAVVIVNRAFDRIELCPAYAADSSGSAARKPGAQCLDVTAELLPFGSLVSPLESTTSAQYWMLQLSAQQTAGGDYAFVRFTPSAALRSEAKLFAQPKAVPAHDTNDWALPAVAAAARVASGGVNSAADALTAHFFVASPDTAMHLPAHFTRSAANRESTNSGVSDNGSGDEASPSASLIARYGTSVGLPAVPTVTHTASGSASAADSTPSFWQWVLDAVMGYTVDGQSFVIRKGSSVYYWQGHVPSGVERFFELQMHTTAPFALVYISSAPYTATERLMYEDDFMLSTRGRKVVRFHRSNVARVVRAVFVVHPGAEYEYRISIAVLSVRSFARTLYSKFTTLPQILIATGFLLIALQYRHYLRYGVFQRFYHIFGFGQRDGAIRLRFSTDSGVMMCVWLVSVWGVVVGSPFSGAYLRFHSDWILEWIWLVAIAFIFVAASAIAWIAIELVCHGLFGVLSLLFANRLYALPAAVVERPHTALFRVISGVSALLFGVWYATWDPNVALSGAAPVWLRVLHSNPTLAAMVLVSAGAALLLVFTNAATWHARAPQTRAFRAYKGTCFLLYLIAAFGSIPNWVFELSSSSPMQHHPQHLHQHQNLQPTGAAANASLGGSGERVGFPFALLPAGVDFARAVWHFDVETILVLVVNVLVLFASLHFPPRPSSATAAALALAPPPTPTRAHDGGVNGAVVSPRSAAVAVASLVPHELRISLFSLHSLPSLLCLSLAGLMGLAGREAMIWLPLLTAVVAATLSLPQSFHALFHHVFTARAMRRNCMPILKLFETLARWAAAVRGGRRATTTAATATDRRGSSTGNGLSWAPPRRGSGDTNGSLRLRSVAEHDESGTPVPTTAVPSSWASPVGPRGVSGDAHAHDSHGHAHDEHGQCPMSPELFAVTPTAAQAATPPTLEI